jgi:opacity protein-like surface antigen
MKIRIPAFIVILLLAVLTVPAFAAPPNYGVLKLGGYLPQASDVEDFDNAFYGELGLGHYFNNNWAIELGVGYTESEASVSGTGGSASVDLRIIPLTLGIRGSIPVGAIEPFATAGVGAYFTEVDASVNIPGTVVGSGSEDDTVFGFYVGAGANYNVSPNIYLGVEGKYFWAEPSFGGVDVKIDGINLTANIGYRF